ncbi:MAG: hypothetical protein R3200_16105 [Xanthomonadales bacterium]|nr:hypothetical protein [Xanthomonadales bacterium]
MRSLLFCLLVGVCGAASAQQQQMCYYWVGSDGAVTSYIEPPFNIASPNPITSEAGRLVITVTDVCSDDKLIRAATAAPPAEESAPALTPAPEVPVPESAPTPRPEAAPSPEPPAAEPSLRPRPESSDTNAGRRSQGPRSPV